MSSSAWKALERTVAAIFGGVRAWDTDHDVLVVTDHRDPRYRLGVSPSGAALLELSRMGVLELASVECKNLKGPTVAQVEGFLTKNAEKMARDGITGMNALVVKRKAGPGKRTPMLFVTEIGVPPDAETQATSG